MAFHIETELKKQSDIIYRLRTMVDTAGLMPFNNLKRSPVHECVLGSRGAKINYVFGEK